jgi:hypothetical protein
MTALEDLGLGQLTLSGPQKGKKDVHTLEDSDSEQTVERLAHPQRLLNDSDSEDQLPSPPVRKVPSPPQERAAQHQTEADDIASGSFSGLPVAAVLETRFFLLCHHSENALICMSTNCVKPLSSRLEPSQPCDVSDP